MSKYQSRATRAAEAATIFSDAAGKLREVIDELKDLQGDQEAELEEVEGEEHLTVSQKDNRRAAFDALVSKAKTALEHVGSDQVQELTDEMGSWRDNMQGTNLENTSKYTTVEEAAAALEDVTQEIDNLDLAPEPAEGESPEDFVCTLEEIADTLETQAENLGYIEFPGMYG